MRNCKIFLIANIILLAMFLVTCEESGVIEDNSASESQSVTPMPAGVVIAFMGEEIPEGWVLCDGRELLRENFPRLFLVIGEMYGNGDGATTFNIPDLRGMFLRGVDNGAGIDPDADDRLSSPGGSIIGDVVGSYQEDEFKSHNHTYAPDWVSAFDFDDNNEEYAIQYQANANKEYFTSSTGGNETRSKNISVNYIIKD